MESIWMPKAKYSYYLANGECIEYFLSPGCDLVDVIDGLVSSYYSSSASAPDIVWVKSEIAHSLNIEVSKKMTLLLGNLTDPSFGILKLQTVVGPVTIVIKSDLDIPIFIGSEQELKDNSFNTSMEKILCD